jgi:hypothetical protein
MIDPPYLGYAREEQFPCQPLRRAPAMMRLLLSVLLNVIGLMFDNGSDLCKPSGRSGKMRPTQLNLILILSQFGE